MSRKYQQKGYMDYDKESKRPKGEGIQFKKEQPQRITVRIFKCSQCGNIKDHPEEITLETICKKCDADLHSCVNCKFFDTSSRFQCAQKISEAVSPKDKRNTCSFFQPKVSLEQRFTQIESQRDARQAFNDLFK